jgi:hypothetical protein
VIHLQIIVANTADLLNAEAYGAGALLRWESSADVAGPYVEGGTEALVADVSLYDVWDAAGTEDTWYRTRISDAGGTTFSPYSSPFLASELGLYLTIAQFRALAPSTLSDETLLILLMAAQEDIIRAIGPAGETFEIVSSRGDLLPITRPALSITSVTERVGWPGNEIALAEEDYELSASRRVLRRLSSGTTPAYVWRSRVKVVYVPVDDTASRQRVQGELTKLAIATNPGLVSQTIGQWSEQYAANSAWNVAEEREKLLSSLSDTSGWVR